jgi:ectoine hydroxylase-related dioxygenase (phytanoyl-CoA dioxygenase family)
LALQALICLDPFTFKNGATYLLPASHHIKDRPSDDYFYKNAHRVIANPGDVVFFDSLIWHAGGKNKTNLPRRGITIVYTRSYMKQQIDLTKALSVDFIKSMPELGKKLIGMNVRVPTSIDEFYLPEEYRLYKPNQG